MHQRFFQPTVHLTPVQYRLQDRIVDRLQKRTGCTLALANALCHAHHGLLTGCERKGRLTIADVHGIWGSHQRNGQSSRPCRPEPCIASLTSMP